LPRPGSIRQRKSKNKGRVIIALPFSSDRISKLHEAAEAVEKVTEGDLGNLRVFKFQKVAIY
jgi:hypothetical protein